MLGEKGSSDAMVRVMRVIKLPDEAVSTKA
jgi:hypothetical protein